MRRFAGRPGSCTAPVAHPRPGLLAATHVMRYGRLPTQTTWPVAALAVFLDLTRFSRLPRATRYVAAFASLWNAARWPTNGYGGMVAILGPGDGGAHPAGCAATIMGRDHAPVAPGLVPGVRAPEWRPVFARAPTSHRHPERSEGSPGAAAPVSLGLAGNGLSRGKRDGWSHHIDAAHRWGSLDTTRRLRRLLGSG